MILIEKIKFKVKIGSVRDGGPVDGERTLGWARRSERACGVRAYERGDHGAEEVRPLRSTVHGRQVEVRRHAWGVYVGAAVDADADVGVGADAAAGERDLGGQSCECQDRQLRKGATTAVVR